ncbi:MAG: RIP metalloprotease RseP [Cytophagales bacterium]
MDGIIMAAQMILGLSILVGVHELGHFLPAKWFGMRVEKFFLFFDVGNFKFFSFKKGDTEYGLGWLPLGGYVKISGMVDESLDTEMLKRPAEPYEFRAKPAWQRLIVMLGGVTVNLITGIVIFVLLTYTLGERFYPAKEIKYGIVAQKLAQEIGLKTGDKIIKINGNEFDNFADVYSPDVLLSSGSYYTINRNDTILDIKIPNDFINKFSDKKNQAAFIDPITPFEVGKVMEGSAAMKAGLKPKDKILAVDSVKINYFHELTSELQNRKGDSVTILVDRENEQIPLKATISAEGKLGFAVQSLLKDSSEKYTFIQSIGKGAMKAFTVTSVQVKAFGKIFSGEIDARSSLSGPIGIAKEFGGTWDWVRFWNLTGILSMVLAFMNILPIPALDGGHVMFTLYEIITRRKPSDKFLEITQKIGMFILFGLMIFAVFNDIVKFF